ncbi:Protein kinase domain-containing protein [Mycena chlorophos]|uniref:non-specific serine/threonine protein kinase n=1 Tax=Mycena chlorophos TaxID=658473 RepID=A0A8H6SED6_MYCCL|nr:Protein kinase domain-containing protein [Mycena chlorophos]
MSDSQFVIPVHGAESIADYAPGGLHPVHIGDKFCDGRYTVVNKLGHGRSSTIWHILDSQTNTYAALKIAASARSSTARREIAVQQHLEARFDAADLGSKYVVRMLDHFVHEGPNGHHQCIVEEALGPSLAADNSCFTDGRPVLDAVHSMAAQLVLGLRYLHKRGVVHGDPHLANILLCIPETEAGSNHQRLMRSPPNKAFHGAPPSPHRPDYLVVGLDARMHEDTYRALFRSNPQIKLCDFGDSYFPGMANPPRVLVAPQLYRPPEALLLEQILPSVRTDVWALAVLLHCLASGGAAPFAFTVDECLAGMAHHLGHFSPILWRMWPNRDKFFDRNGQLRLDLDEEDDMYVPPTLLGTRVDTIMPVDGAEREAF